MKIAALAVAGFALATADRSCSPQVGTGPGPCEFTTTCLSGTIKWSYPNNDCQWIFYRDAASSLELSASWFTALGVNVTFYDGREPKHAKVLGSVEGKSDKASMKVTSTTGLINVMLHGPPQMKTYALNFDYKLEDECSGHRSDCNKCLTAGCGLVSGGWCVPDCPVANCYSDVGFGIDDACSAYQLSMDQSARCHPKSDCQSCLAAECHWNKKGNSCVSLSDCNFPDQPCDLADTCEISRVKGPKNRTLSSILKRLR